MRISMTMSLSDSEMTHEIGSSRRTYSGGGSPPTESSGGSPPTHCEPPGSSSVDPCEAYFAPSRAGSRPAPEVGTALTGPCSLRLPVVSTSSSM
jgi:hypothetical protein